MYWWTGCAKRQEVMLTSYIHSFSQSHILALTRTLMLVESLTYTQSLTHSPTHTFTVQCKSSRYSRWTDRRRHPSPIVWYSGLPWRHLTMTAQRLRERYRDRHRKREMRSLNPFWHRLTAFKNTVKEEKKNNSRGLKGCDRGVCR